MNVVAMRLGVAILRAPGSSHPAFAPTSFGPKSEGLLSARFIQVYIFPPFYFPFFFLLMFRQFFPDDQRIGNLCLINLKSYPKQESKNCRHGTKASNSHGSIKLLNFCLDWPQIFNFPSIRSMTIKTTSTCCEAVMINTAELQSIGRQESEFHNYRQKPWLASIREHFSGQPCCTECSHWWVVHCVGLYKDA